MKALTVYKASAGSGKTFTLATEYIKLLVMLPTGYRNILAVTFTNKATEEMKTRILSQLYGLWKKLGDSRPYLRKIADETGCTDEFISQRAGEALHLLLHNYNYFHVETIDTFFQSVLRNLARELDLTANLRIGLNDVQVEEEAVDQLFDSLTVKDTLLQWIMKYIMDSISDDRSWNIIGQVKLFGRTIFRDYYKSQSSRLQPLMNDSHFFDQYAKQLRDIRHNAQKQMQQYGEQFSDILSDEHLDTSDFLYGKAGVAGFFGKLLEGTFDESIVGKRVADAADNPTKWCKKDHQRACEIQTLADSRLIPLLRQAIGDQPLQWRRYQSAELTLRHLNQLRLLGSIEQKVHEINEDANRFLLSDTQQLLHALVKDSDSPFIFEKIGARLEHVMIDEFQDTSSVQWQNFKILLQECMSHANSQNLIVGDVKQSIYRWRSGDWRLLNAIESEFPHSGDMLEVRSLATNYRSSRNVIDFNNAFFVAAAKMEYDNQREEYPEGAEQLRHAYADVEQQVPDKRPPSGRVEVNLLADDDYQPAVLQLLAHNVGRLLDAGAEQKDIAILVRTNALIPVIADYFAANMPQVNIVSDEAFRLDASSAVNLLVQALHLLTHPDDLMAKATVVKLYQTVVMGKTLDDHQLFIGAASLDEQLPEAFTAHTGELLQQPLYELAERLYAIFQLQQLSTQSAYVAAFFDQLSQFALENTTDIDAFIAEWEQTISGKTIQSDQTVGVRILSIHKSKGLEFPNVIIPFCDWRLEHADILWCQPNEPPFDALPVVPVDYSEKQMRGTIYEHYYLDEHLQNTVDNLNLLYVAFTRAADNLFVIGKRAARNSRAQLIEQVLPLIHMDGACLEGETDEQASMVFTYGQLEVRKQKGEAQRQSDNVFLQPVGTLQVGVTSFDSRATFKQSNRSRDFMADDDEQAQNNYIRTGSILHEVFSTIRTAADINSALLALEQSGILYDDELTRSNLTSLLQSRLQDPQVADWFSDKWQVFNECSILHTLDDGTVVEHRPDRVMTNGQETHVVDFKFGRPKTEYRQQVLQYMQLLKDMGLPSVKGFIWYVYNNKVERI